MKDNLFEMLLNLFEKTLAQLKENHVATNGNDRSSGEQDSSLNTIESKTEWAFIKSANRHSLRVLTEHEQIKLTKASQQFLMRMARLGIISSETFELILNQLIFSDSRFVSLQETKWAMRSILASDLDSEQLAFLDLVLYQQEDKLQSH